VLRQYHHKLLVCAAPATSARSQVKKWSVLIFDTDANNLQFLANVNSLP